jgi:hypothetical protein
MDVVEEGFLEMNEEWGNKMLRRTAIILSWYVTLYFGAASDPTKYIGNGSESGAGGVIDATEKTNALGKGDTPFTGWPVLKKPAKWQKKMGKVVDYGELKGSKVADDLAREDLDIEIVDETSAKKKMRPDVPPNVWKQLRVPCVLSVWLPDAGLAASRRMSFTMPRPESWRTTFCAYNVILRHDPPGRLVWVLNAPVFRMCVYNALGH